MKRREGLAKWRWAGIGLLAASAVPLWWARPSGGDPPRQAERWDVPGEIVVQLREGSSAADVAALGRQLGASLLGFDAENNPGDILTLDAAPAQAVSLLAALRRDSRVVAAEPQHLFKAFQAEGPLTPNNGGTGSSPIIGGGGGQPWKPNDPRYGEQWNFRRIHMEEAWPVTKGKGAVVAVIDTGVAFETDAKCYQAEDFDKTKFTKPYDFVSRDKHPTDDNGHGTHVAGTIAESTDNGKGVAGIAYEAEVMPLKVLTKEGYGKMSDVAAAIRYAADKGANVINMSLGAGISDAITRQACQYAYKKGVAIVCAAGNDGREGVSYPAAYPECIAVSALGPTGELAFYSSWGKQVAIAAPGGDKMKGGDAGGILQNTYYRQSADKQEDGYFAFQGTSMATPHVAGVAALIVSQGVKDPSEIKAVLQKSAQKVKGPREKFGAGELDAAAAVKLAGGANRAYWQRLTLIGGVWVAALLIGGARSGKSRSGPIAGALALTIGLVLPDVVALYAGWDSLWTLLGHSALLPGYLLCYEADSPSERRFLALFGAAVAAHIGWDLWSGLAPAVGAVDWASLPWLWANLAVGTGTFISGLRR